MDSSQKAEEDIDAGLDISDQNKSNNSHNGSIDESVLEIPTFGFTEKSWRTNFVLIVEGRRLYVDKAILYLASPVFDTMFQSDFKGSSSDELELPGKRLRDVVDFLRYICPSTLTKMTPDSAVNVLPLVEEYQVNHLKPICETAILESVSEDIPVEKLSQILQVACLYNLGTLRKQCVKIACKKSQEDIDEAFENNPPPVEAAKEILKELNIQLRETVSEQKILIDDISREATENTKTLKAKNIEQERQLHILKQYLFADVKKNKVISLGSDSYWREKTIILEVDMVEKNKKVEREIIIWDVPIVICISEQSSGNVSFLHIELRSKDNKIKSKLKGRVIIVNRQPQGENETVFFDGSILPGSSYFCRVSQNLMKLSSVKDIGKGFLRNGCIGIIVQVYMSEPNRG